MTRLSGFFPALILAVSGCQTAPKNQPPPARTIVIEDADTVYQRIQAEEKAKRDARSQIKEGMSWQELRALMGAPDRISESAGAGGRSEIWFYDRGHVFLRSGRVSSWTFTR